MKIYNIFIVFVLLLPMLASAATNDFTANSDITVSSVTFGSGTADLLILNGSTAESWQFSNGAFTVTNPGTFKVGSADISVKSIQFSSGGTTLVCSENTTPGTSFATAPTAAGTYTITPSATTDCTNLCSVVSNAASYNSFPTCGAASCNVGYKLSGSGGNATCITVGGGGVFVPCGAGYTLSGGLCYPNKVSTNANGTVGINSSIISNSEVSAIFTHTLGLGMEGSDITRLQKLLARDPSLYPEGLVTGFFGPLTEKAVQRFQAKYSLVSSGNPKSTGYGLVGPLTRAKLAEVFSGAALPVKESGANHKVFFRKLSHGDSGNDVRLLQEFLNHDSNTKLANKGVGSPGNETNYFGYLTETAVQKFQLKYGIVSSGNPETTGFGLVGPKTRVKLNELLNQ